MTLENTFYVLGIIFMVMNIAILIGLVVGVFFIKKKIEEIQLITMSKSGDREKRVK